MLSQTQVVHPVLNFVDRYQELASMTAYPPDKKQWIFVVGYPKSGNTWLTRLVGEALDSPTGSGYFRHAQEIATEGASRSGPFFVLKSHHSKIDRPEHLQPPIIYILRDFCDVLVSGFFGVHKWDESALELNAKRSTYGYLRRVYFDWYISRMIKRWQGLPLGTIYYTLRKMRRTVLVPFGQFQPENRISVGNWSEHVRYWTQEPGAVIVQYECLLQDTYGELVRCFNELNLPYESDQVARAVQHQSFTSRKESFEKAGDHQNATFMRKGVAGDWRKFLSKRQLDYVYRLHGEVLAEFGYL